VTEDEIRNYAAVWRPALEVSGGGATVHVPPPPVASGQRFTAIWQSLDGGRQLLDASENARPAMLAEAAAAAGIRADQNTGKRAPASTAFAVVDNRGGAVSCAMTMNQPFGVRRVAAESGVVLAATAGRDGDGTSGLMPVVVVNRPVFSLTQAVGISYAAAAGSGEIAPAAMVQTLAALLEGNHSLTRALNEPRALAGGDTAYYEANAGQPTEIALRKQGYDAKPVVGLGRVNVIFCPGGLPDEPQTCQFRADPRGYGMGVAGGL
jgi:gamma-glutamyltranspeptidase/glutathione hydrolase